MTPIRLETTPKKSEKEKEEREERKKNWHTPSYCIVCFEDKNKKRQNGQNGAIFCGNVLANPVRYIS